MLENSEFQQASLIRLGLHSSLPSTPVPQWGVHSLFTPSEDGKKVPKHPAPPLWSGMKPLGLLIQGLIFGLNV